MQGFLRESMDRWWIWLIESLFCYLVGWCFSSETILGGENIGSGYPRLSWKTWASFRDPTPFNISRSAWIFCNTFECMVALASGSSRPENEMLRFNHLIIGSLNIISNAKRLNIMEIVSPWWSATNSLFSFRNINNKSQINQQQSVEFFHGQLWNTIFLAICFHCPNVFTTVVVVVVFSWNPRVFNRCVIQLPRRTCLHPGHASVIVRTAEVCFDSFWDLRHWAIGKCVLLLA